MFSLHQDNAASNPMPLSISYATLSYRSWATPDPIVPLHSDQFVVASATMAAYGVKEKWPLFVSNRPAVQRETPMFLAWGQ